MVYKRVTGWTSEQSLPMLNFVECPPGEVWIFSDAGNRTEKDIKAEEKKKCHIMYSYNFYYETWPQLSPPPKDLTLDLAQYNGSCFDTAVVAHHIDWDLRN